MGQCFVFGIDSIKFEKIIVKGDVTEKKKSKNFISPSSICWDILVLFNQKGESSTCETSITTYRAMLPKKKKKKRKVSGSNHIFSAYYLPDLDHTS